MKIRKAKETAISQLEQLFSREGIGRNVAAQVFNQFPGVWETSQIPDANSNPKTDKKRRLLIQMARYRSIII